jgi:hypothetical protein
MSAFWYRSWLFEGWPVEKWLLLLSMSLSSSVLVRSQNIRYTPCQPCSYILAIQLLLLLPLKLLPLLP